MNMLKRCIDSIRRKVSYVLKWSPVSFVYSFSGTRLQLFSSYHEHILNENLQYIYMINTSLSISILFLYLFYIWLNQRISAMKVDVKTYCALSFVVASILYHALVFILLKVNGLKKWIQKITGLLNLVSFVVLHLFLGSRFLLNSSTSPLSMLDAGVSIAAFEGSVVTFYFQNSFVISSLIWLALAVVTCLMDLIQISDFTDKIGTVVSCYCGEYLHIKAMCVCAQYCVDSNCPTTILTSLYHSQLLTHTNAHVHIHTHTHIILSYMISTHTHIHTHHE